MISKGKICIVTQSHLCCNPRVLKEALKLADNGYEVSIVTSILSEELRLQDSDLIRNHNLSIHTISNLTVNNLNSFFDRALKKFGGMLIRYFQIENSLALGYGSYRYFDACKKINANLYICHQEVATYIGNKLFKSGYKVAFDFEDWYSEDLLPGARSERPVNLLHHSESMALNNNSFCITTSYALAEMLKKTYSCKMPDVIYNVFPVKNFVIQKRRNYNTPIKLFWFSQTIGAGRGLENFIQLMAQIHKSMELHLLGHTSEDYKNMLIELTPHQHKIYFHSLVEEGQLARKIASFDVGLVLELNQPLSRNYTITNKFFQYIQAGLPVIVTETAGQIEAFQEFEPGFLLPQHPLPEKIIELENWLHDHTLLNNAREQSIKAAAKYNWETESIKLTHLVNQAFETTS